MGTDTVQIRLGAAVRGTKKKKQRTCPFYDYITFANGNKFLGHRHRREKIARVEFTSYRHGWVRVQPLGDLSVDSRQVIERNYRIRNNRTDHVTNVILGIRLFFFSSLTQPHLVLSTSSLPPPTTNIPPFLSTIINSHFSLMVSFHPLSVRSSLPLTDSSQSHHTPEPVNHVHHTSAEHDSHHDAHVLSLRLVLGSILAPVR